MEYFNTYYSKGIRTLSALGSLAVDYRLGPDAAPWFLSGGIGECSHLFNGGGAGLGVFAGGGRDLGRRSQIRLLVSHGRPEMFEAAPRFDSGTSTITASVILGMLWR